MRRRESSGVDMPWSQEEARPEAHRSPESASARIGGLAGRRCSIGNEPHWVLDRVSGEDQSRIRDRNAVTNWALLCRLALALIHREQSDPRASIETKRRRVGWDDDYRFTVLAAIRPGLV